MYVYVYTQNGALETSVGTEQIRANLPHRTCYAVSEARHGAYVIPEYARLDASRLEEKGTCYDKDGPDVTPEQVRAPLMSHDLFKQVAGQNAALMDPPRPPLALYCGEDVAYMQDGRGVTWQEWWDTRWSRLPAPFRAGSPQYQAYAAQYGVPPAAAPPPAPEPAAADPLPEPDGFRPDPALVRALPRVMAAQREKFAALLEAAAPAAPATPKDLAAASGMGRTWVHAQLGGLAELGLVTQVSRGRYASVPGADIAAGLAEIRARADRLAADARQIVNAQ
jgi:hypothetical protein